MQGVDGETEGKHLTNIYRVGSGRETPKGAEKDKASEVGVQ